ncbi:MAG: hypothetical protein NC182_03135 [Prevotella sp.]|nr:hypothetical protein [Staphylococcus sp.]MCM1350170.1 hypothetical protein [Prevotella sp.]
MNFKKDFSPLYKEYLKSAILKSLILATLISCSVLFIVSFVFWMVDVKQFWIALIVFGILEVTIFFITFSRLKPTDRKLSKKLDELGLQQRVVTMYQYQNDNSLMAKIQRGNAIEHINKVNKKLVKLVTPVLIIVLLFVSILSSATTTILAALSSNDVIKPGSDTLVPSKVVEYEVTYDTMGEGFIEGDIFQVVVEGKSTTPVVAVPEEGWAFNGWVIVSPSTYTSTASESDPYRIDENVKANLVICAQFVEVEELDGEEGEPGDEPGEDSKPTPPSNQEQQKPGEKGEEGESGAGGKYEENNQVIDGQTYYGDKTFDNAYEDAMNNLQQDSNMSEGLKDIIGDYYSTIEK